MLGLPFERRDAQSVVDALGSGGHRCAVLWDRTGYAPERSAHGMSRLEGIADCWVLNPLHVPMTRRMLPNARVQVAPLAVPNVFFQMRPRGRSQTTRAVFIGRFVPSKGAYMLAERWMDEVWPTTGLQLTLAGRGLGNVVDEAAIARLAERSLAIRTVRLMSEKARAHYLANAAVAIFPATYDYMPQALAETVAVGTSVVATDIDGHRPLAPPHIVSSVLRLDMGNLAEAVVGVLNNPEAASKRAVAGRELVRRDHSMDETGRRLSSLLAAI